MLWAVQTILKEKTTLNGKKKYFVKWLNFDESDNSWETEYNVSQTEAFFYYKNKIEDRVEEVLKHRLEGTKKTEFLVRWKNQEKLVWEYLEQIERTDAYDSYCQEAECFIEKIIDQKVEVENGRKSCFVLVQWENYDQSFDTWEPYDDFKDKKAYKEFRQKTKFNVKKVLEKRKKGLHEEIKILWDKQIEAEWIKLTQKLKENQTVSNFFSASQSNLRAAEKLGKRKFEENEESDSDEPILLFKKKKKAKFSQRITSKPKRKTSEKIGTRCESKALYTPQQPIDLFEDSSDESEESSDESVVKKEDVEPLFTPGQPMKLFTGETKDNHEMKTWSCLKRKQMLDLAE